MRMEDGAGSAPAVCLGNDRAAAGAGARAWTCSPVMWTRSVSVVWMARAVMRVWVVMRAAPGGRVVVAARAHVVPSASAASTGVHPHPALALRRRR